MSRAGGGGASSPSCHSDSSSEKVRLISVIIAVFVVALIFSIAGFVNTSPASSCNREKLELGVEFNNECVVDEIGWFDNAANTSLRLQIFFEKTGVQPFIVLKAYDASLTTDEAKEAYAREWYNTNIDNETTFLYMYFAEENVGEDLGYMTHVSGLQIGSVMDAEAIEIFWSYLDGMWQSDMSVDDLFVSAFDKTANKIMQKSTTNADVAKYAVFFFGIGVSLTTVLIIAETKRKHETKKAQKTELFLNNASQNNNLAKTKAERSLNNHE